METGNHTINTLFDQLGLDSSEVAIRHFVLTQPPLPKNLPLYQATLWSSSQALFLKEAISQDSDWSNVVDQLDVMLRKTHPLSSRQVIC